MELIDENNYHCFCGYKIKEKELKEHLKNCKQYQKESPISFQFNAIPLELLEKDKLIGIRCEMLTYQRMFQDEILRRKEGKLIKQPQNDNEMFFQNFQSQDFTQCNYCLKLSADFDMEKYWCLVNCKHCVCKDCLRKQIKMNYLKENGQVKCPVLKCSIFLSEEDYINIVGIQGFEQLNEELLEITYNIVKCCKCQEKFEFIKGKPDPNTRDSKGKSLTNDQLINYVENRFICPNSHCKSEQCLFCKFAPYHIGYTCVEWKEFNSLRKCRFCGNPVSILNENLPISLQLVCNEPDCVNRSTIVCQKILACNHPCNGIFKEINCLDCLDDNCAMKNENLLGQKGSDFCVICYSESLASAPCIKLNCGHILHFECVSKRIDLRWTSPKISFTFCECPSCKTWMQFAVDCSLQKKMEKNIAKFEEIKKKSLERLKYEGKENDKELITPGSQFYQKKLEYALKIFQYFECFKCKNSYFGGHKDCRGGENEKEDFKPEELVCANCCDIPIEDCKIHGKEFIEFKCKFCCNIAQWYCWGSTHFCEPCHKRQVDGDYVSKYTVDKLPKCGGKNSCPLKIDHKPNGEECALGCSICRNVVENKKEF